MNVALIAAVAAALLLVALAAFALVTLRKADKEGAALQQPRRKVQATPSAADVDELEGGLGPARRRGGTDRMRAGQMRQRLAARLAEQQATAAPAAGGATLQRALDSDSAAGSGSDGNEDGSDDSQEHQLTRKEQAKKERREAREAERRAREARDGRTSAYEERRQKKDAEREAQEKAQEDEIRRADIERQAREDAEAAKWLGMMSVENEGTGEAAMTAEDQGLLGQFVDYIKAHKTVPLEQLAIEFGLRTTEVIDRVNGLEAMGRITGVMDDRGKYIYISLEEMHAVAAYINSKGRVAIGELAAKSNTFIDLEAKSAAVAAVGSARAATLDFDAMLLEQ